MDSREDSLAQDQQSQTQPQTPSNIEGGGNAWSWEASRAGIFRQFIKSGWRTK